MITKIINGKLILPDGIEENSFLYLQDEKILAVTKENLPFDKEMDAKDLYVSPGFIDIHVHGGDGFEFIDATEEAVLKSANIHARHGTTTIFPTLSAYDENDTCAALAMVKKCQHSSSLLPHMPGVHLEGPYFSPKQSGAQDPRYIRNPDPQEYHRMVEKYGDAISRWSYAPERDGSVEFQKFLNEHHILGAAAHTDAEYCHMKAVYDLGCRLVTHLYSCTSTITRHQGYRHLGVIETAYLIKDMDVEAIADGCHLPPLLLKMIYQIKGSDHMCLITDAIRFGGRSDCDSTLTGTASMPYIIEDGVAKLMDRSAFAGSIATTDTLVRTCYKKADIPLSEAVKMATQVPARIMNLPHTGKIAPGYNADLVLFDGDVNVKEVLVSGKAIA